MPTRPRAHPFLVPLLALPLLLAGCGGADPAALTDQGYAELQAGEWSDARESFEEALAQLDPADTQAMRAKLGQVEALVRIDPAAAKREFLDFAGANPSRVDAKDYAFVAGKLANDREFDVAIDVLHAGREVHVEHPKLLALTRNIEEQATAAGDSEAIKKLRSFGYAGGK